MENPLPKPPSRLPSELEETGYRFALLLTGDAGAALRVLREVLAEASEELAQFRSRERRKICLIRRIRARALKGGGREAETANEDAPGQGGALFRQVAALPEPARSAFALFHHFEGGVEEMAEIFRLKSSAFVQALADARQALAPGAVFPEAPLLKEHRPWGGDRSKVARAVKKAGDAPELAAQAEADSRWHAEIEQTPIPPEIAALVQAVPARPRLRSLVLQPTVLSILLALVVVVGVVIYVVETRKDNFSGKEAVEEMVQGTVSTTEPDYDPLPDTEAGKLDDWFVLKGFSGYNVPSALEKATAVGGRVFRHDGLLLAEVALKLQNARLLVFHLADLKKTEIERGGWHIYQQDDWAVAVLRDEANGYVLMFEGDSDDMPGFLNAVGK